MTEYLIETEAAGLLHISPKTLQRFRQEGTGPRYFKAGRRVLYTRSEIDGWLQQNSFRSTSEASQARLEGGVQ